jgi:PTS system nitrogen regulatory IIA component
MANVTQILDIASVRCRAKALSRKRALELAAELVAASNGMSSDALFDELMERERLGSTGLGEGVAIPHCRMDCDAMRVAFFTLQTPIDYEAPDGEHVDILFVIVVPTDESEAHLHALATLSEIFTDPQNRQALRACRTDDELLDCLRHLAEPDAGNSLTA